jgi:hypothetical protein
MNAPCKYEEQRKELDYFKTLVNIALKSGNHADKSPETLLNIMLTAKDFGISPMKALNGGFYVVKGKLGMSTALMADRIRKEGHSIKIPEWTSQKCTIIGVRKDNGDSVKVEFTKEDAELAGLTESPIWKRYPKNMYYNRAMSTLGRVLFPDILGSSYSEDEKYDLMDIPPSKRPIEDSNSMIPIEDSDSIIPIEDSDSIMMKQLVSSEKQVSGLPHDQMLSILLRKVELEEIPHDHVEDYLNLLSERSGRSVEQIVDSALLKERFPKFLEYYQKYLGEKKEVDQLVSV